MRILISTALFFMILAPIGVHSQGVEALEVSFIVNDAFVKDRLLGDVALSVAREAGGEAFVTGLSDSDGQWKTELPAGTFFVSYRRAGYVPIGSSKTSIHSNGQIITTTLSMLLESEGGEFARRVRIVLNWGSDDSQVKDADSHILCPCGNQTAHVFFSSKDHVHQDGLTINLDVDDTDWGGPETITLNDPEPGRYEYWVHNYSGEPARLGASDVVVRVFFDDEVAGEYHVPPDVSERNWRPFEALVVESDFRPRIRPFTDDELKQGFDRQEPDLPIPPTQPPRPSRSSDPKWLRMVALAFFAFFVIRLIRRKRR
jgi:hypothetical protein